MNTTNETLTTDCLLHDLIVPTVNEHYNEDDHYGVARAEDNEQVNNWGAW
jgi:hypothetical protein